MKNKKQILDSIMCMAKCSVAATALNPGSYLLVDYVIMAILYNAVVYIALGTPVYYLLRNKSWIIQTIAVCFTANVIMIIFFSITLNSSNPFKSIILVPFAIAGVLSIFPIGYLCHKTKMEMEYDQEIERIQGTDD